MPAKIKESCLTTIMVEAIPVITIIVGTTVYRTILDMLTTGHSIRTPTTTVYPFEPIPVGITALTPITPETDTPK
jgi:hypothetical protein